MILIVQLDYRLAITEGVDRLEHFNFLCVANYWHACALEYPGKTCYMFAQFWRIAHRYALIVSVQILRKGIVE